MSPIEIRGFDQPEAVVTYPLGETQQVRLAGIARPTNLPECRTRVVWHRETITRLRGRTTRPRRISRTKGVPWLEASSRPLMRGSNGRLST